MSDRLTAARDCVYPGCPVPNVINHLYHTPTTGHVRFGSTWNVAHHPFITAANAHALAATEAPGRVAALEAAGMRAARDAHAAWLRAGIGQHTPTLIEECPNEWCREHVAALAAPAPPAGVSGEVCAVCKDVRLGVQHDRYSMSAWHPYRSSAHAPTPSEPVARLAVPVLCNLAGHPSRLHHHDRDGKVRMVPTPATRDE